MKFISYPSTEQFRSVVKKVREKTQFNGYDEEKKEVIWNKDVKLPTLIFKGTVKLHGTQGAVVQFPDGTIQYQSRKNIVTLEKDNAGFAFFCNSRKDLFEKIFKDIRKNVKDSKIISLYGEFFGGNIQKNVMINGIPKSFALFGVKVSEVINDELVSEWLEYSFLLEDEFKENNIYDVNDFKTYSIEIDFNDNVKLAEAQNEMLKLTTEVGDLCPVGSILNPENDCKTGEGIVWKSYYKGERLVFKTKDERHSKGTGKVKTLKPVDEELENKKRTFVNEIACTESRLNQMFTEIVHSEYNGDEQLITMKDMGAYLKLIHKDIIKENSEDLVEQGLEPKTINSMVSKVARDYFKDRLDVIAGF